MVSRNIAIYLLWYALVVWLHSVLCSADQRQTSSINPLAGNDANFFVALLPNHSNTNWNNLRIAVNLAVTHSNQHFAALYPNEHVSLQLEATVNYSGAYDVLKSWCSVLKQFSIHGAVGLPTADAATVLTQNFEFLGLPIFTTATINAAVKREDIPSSESRTPTGAEPSLVTRRTVLNMQQGAEAMMETLKNYLLYSKERRENETREEDASVEGLHERIAVLYESGYYGSSLMPALRQAIQTGSSLSNARVSLSMEYAFERGTSVIELRQILTLIRQGDLHIIVIISDNFDGSVNRILSVAADLELLGENYQWYFTDTGGEDMFVMPLTAVPSAFQNSTAPNTTTPYVMPRIYSSIQHRKPLIGSLSVQSCVYSKEDRYLAVAEEYMALGGVLRPDGTLPNAVIYIYDAVWALNSVLHGAQRLKGSPLIPFSTSSCVTEQVWADSSYVHDFVWNSGHSLTGSLIADHIYFDPSTGHILPAPVLPLPSIGAISSPSYCISNMYPSVSTGAEFVDMRMLANDGSFVKLPANPEQYYPGLARSYTQDTEKITGKHLRIATQPSPPFGIYEGTGTSQRIYGITISTIEALSAAMQFTYELISVNGTIDDLLDRLDSGEADMAASWISITSYRMASYQFTVPYYDVTSVFVEKTMDELESDMWAVFYPFSWDLWLSISLYALVACFLFFFIEGWRNSAFREKSQIRIFLKSCYITFSTLLNHVSHEPKTFSGYVLTVAWLIFSFIIYASYTAELASSLLAIRKLDWFAGGLTVLTTGQVSLSSIGVLAGDVPDKFFREEVYGCGWNCPEEKIQYRRCVFLRDCLDMVVDEAVKGVILDRPIVEYYRKTDYCGRIKITGDASFRANYGIVLSKSSPAILDDLNLNILLLRELGSIEDFRDVYVPAGGTCDAESSTLNQLGPTQFGGMFIISSCLIGLAMLIKCLRWFGFIDMLKRRYKVWSEKSGFSKVNRLPKEAAETSESEFDEMRRQIMEIYGEVELSRKSEREFRRSNIDAAKAAMATNTGDTVLSPSGKSSDIHGAAASNLSSESTKSGDLLTQPAGDQVNVAPCTPRDGSAVPTAPEATSPSESKLHVSFQVTDTSAGENSKFASEESGHMTPEPTFSRRRETRSVPAFLNPSKFYSLLSRDIFAKSSSSTPPGQNRVFEAASSPSNYSEVPSSSNHANPSNVSALLSNAKPSSRGGTLPRRNSSTSPADIP